jgi:MOSC domain-containing protein YiiM
MKLLSINVSRPKTVTHLGRPVTTGIFKEQVKGRVMLRQLNLDGDEQADLTVHGGVDQAVYVYSSDHYDYWQRELKRDTFAFGQFGENFIVQGMSEDAVCIGDVFRVGDAVVEVTQPRVPCFKLAMKMGLPDFPKRFMASGRSGFYLRVLQEGKVGAGDTFDRIKADPARLSVRDALRLRFFDKDNLELIRVAANIPGLSDAWRVKFMKRLQQPNGSN